MKNQKIFRGFSTQDFDRTRDVRLYDIDLIKADLMAHFQTRVGERAMRPTFGCRIWDYLMEQMTESNRKAIFAEVKRIVQSDSRLALLDAAMTEVSNGLRIEITLSYEPYQVVETFSVLFERRDAALFSQDF